MSGPISLTNRHQPTPNIVGCNLRITNGDRVYDRMINGEHSRCQRIINRLRKRVARVDVTYLVGQGMKEFVDMIGEQT